MQRPSVRELDTAHKSGYLLLLLKRNRWTQRNFIWWSWSIFAGRCRML